jgi:hypothetical protein
MRSSVFWNIRPCNPAKENRSACYLLHADFLLLFNPEDGGNMLLRNFG